MTSSVAPPLLVALPDGIQASRSSRDPSSPDVNVLVLVVPGALEPQVLAELGDRVRYAVADHLGRPALAAVPDPIRQRRLEVGEIAMDLERLRVTVSGREVELRHQELRLLRTFLEYPGRVFSRKQLMAQAWDRKDDGRTVDVHVRRLRAKLGVAAARIVTVRGFGYRMDSRSAV